ncbi:hypothetical protein EMCG_06164 [[Emmonsia] crescens]|uniref:Uncharacterized protein n=1 Tax=[Emmonsia] crescens TaxID=73230 RepID=A0A0G2IC82_9EURO|nr:hypothetical protein EMCG_06164 [Emmonsia crescens UAMH 3008]
MMGLPEKFEEWAAQTEHEIELEQEKARDINLIGDWKSASMTDLRHFLTFRALWTVKRQAQFFPEIWGIKNISGAHKLLENISGWSAYLDQFDKPKTAPLPIPKLQSFSLVWYYQRFIFRVVGDESSSRVSARLRPRPAQDKDNRDTSPTPPPKCPSTPPLERSRRNLSLEVTFDKLDIQSDDDSNHSVETTPESITNRPSPQSPAAAESKVIYPRVADEQIVNTALIIFLNAISIESDGVKAEWSLQRKIFRVLKPNESTILFRAATDGHLSMLDKPEVSSKAIVEVKPFMRNFGLQTRYQETAQMVAWIFTEPDIEKKDIYRRFLVSQNRHEIYLTIAEYDDAYVKYLHNENKDTKSMMKMNEFGPWTLSSKSHMRDFAAIMLAFTLQHSELKS